MDVNKNINVRLVKCVEKYPCLYNINLKEYYQLECTEEAWIDIAMELRSTPDVVKHKWKRLRSIFVGNLRMLHMGELIKPYYLHEHMQFIMPYLQIPWDPERRCKQLLEESEKLWAKENHVADHDLDEAPDISNYLEILEYPHNADQTNIKLERNELTSNKRGRRKSTDKEADNYPHLKGCKRRSKLKHRHKHRYTSTSSEENCDNSENDNPKTHFLLSMLPDVEEMNNAQMRLFKTRVLSLINDILDNREQ